MRNDANAECRMRNAEFHGKVTRGSTSPCDSAFRIPHSPFRIMLAFTYVSPVFSRPLLPPALLVLRLLDRRAQAYPGPGVRGGSEGGARRDPGLIRVG